MLCSYPCSYACVLAARQVLTSGEESKSGCHPSEAVALARHIVNSCPRLSLAGLCPTLFLPPSLPPLPPSLSLSLSPSLPPSLPPSLSLSLSPSLPLSLPSLSLTHTLSLYTHTHIRAGVAHSSGTRATAVAYGKNHRQVLETRIPEPQTLNPKPQTGRGNDHRQVR